MFELLKDYYTQNIRIDLASAEQLARLNPDVASYQSAAQDKMLVVSVLQGDVHESVYATLMEKFFDSFDEAQQIFLKLIRENPDAVYFDFVSEHR
ncbi:hypothetical protein [Roseovarius sp.]|uniref:hypothetical protein n=1 Tax=Roseovarius sp. TaxID=1486281 RepID=UPI003BAC0C59